MPMGAHWMKTALIVIDLQKDFLAHLPAERAEKVVACTGKLVDTARRVGAPVIWIIQQFKADLSDGFLEMRDRQIATVIEGTPGAELADGLEPAVGEPVIVKKRYSAFFGTDLEDRLAALGVERVVLAGVNIHACIRMAALDAYQRDLRVILPIGAMDGHDQAHNAITLDYLDGKAARVMSLEEAAEALRS